MKRKKWLTILLRLVLSVCVLILFFYVLLFVTGNLEGDGLFGNAVLLLTGIFIFLLYAVEKKS